MGTALKGFHHVKLPVSDVERSRRWYERTLGLSTHIEFVEEGELMGVAMVDADDTLSVAIRRDPIRAAALAGFDPVALCVPTAEALKDWLQRLDDRGESHGGVVVGHVGRVIVGLCDPDGIEIRLYLPAEAVAGSQR